MYAFLFRNLMKRSRHQKQHLKQQRKNRATAFWEPGKETWKKKSLRFDSKSFLFLGQNKNISVSKSQLAYQFTIQVQKNDSDHLHWSQDQRTKSQRTCVIPERQEYLVSFLNFILYQNHQKCGRILLQSFYDPL